MIDFPDTEPAPELEQRMPPGTQIVIALLSGVILGLLCGLLWTWWQT